MMGGYRLVWLGRRMFGALRQVMRMGDINQMLRDIEAEVRFTRTLIGKNALDARVMEAMGRVPREQFVPLGMKPFAFDNRPLPIGHGQTISQPYIVALMTDLVRPHRDAVVLEVGTGCGYQAAVLGQVVKEVYSVEIVDQLAEEAAARLKALGYHNVHVRAGDGYLGWEEHAPYDGILVAAAAGNIPEPLVAQLKPGGRLVIPIGLPYMSQALMVVEKNLEGRTTTREVLGVAFVPLTRREESRDDPPGSSA